MKLIVDCPICGEHSHHIIGEEGSRTYQCLNCGYASSDNFSGKKEEHPQYKTLTAEMKEWSVQADERWYIPSIITLPFAMVYPHKDNRGDLKWAFAKMVDIPEQDKEKYPKEDGSGYYDRRFDVENAFSYDSFALAMREITDIAKEQQSQKEQELPKIPKLKKK
tara:strand:- start:892 stop:1383 length:492 start_codon:yes stop_codon:yes gene_type:complete